MTIKPRKTSKSLTASLKKLDIIQPKDQQQREYAESLQNNLLTFCSARAGAGKTLMALIEGVRQILLGNVQKIVYIRCYLPETSIEKSMGALPGDAAEKLSEFKRPIYDCLSNVLPEKEIDSMFEEGFIETTSISFLRGRTLDNAFVIADEMQQSDKLIMYMVLSRLGKNSRMAILGSHQQVDYEKSYERYKFIIAESLKHLDYVGVCKLERCYRNEQLNEVLSIIESL